MGIPLQLRKKDMVAYQLCGVVWCLSLTAFTSVTAIAIVPPPRRSAVTPSNGDRDLHHVALNVVTALKSCHGNRDCDTLKYYCQGDVSKIVGLLSQLNPKTRQ